MSPCVLLQFGCLAAFAILLIAAGWQDLHTMRISNRLPLAIAAASVVWALAGWELGRVSIADLSLAAACAAIVFAIGGLAFTAGAVGGGDVKLLAAATLFAGPNLLFDFLMVTALAGGALGLAMLAGARIGPSAAGADGAFPARLRNGLPYGPAIAAGGLWVAASLAVS